jgi:transposase
MMAYRYGDRNQNRLLPPSIEEYVPDDAPVRAYDAFVDALNFSKLGIEIEPHKVGNPQYAPQVMLKLLLYGYSYGIRSSRKLEREAHYNLSFIWLTGGLKPDHKTIAEFRRRNKSSLQKVLKQCARLCIQLDLIDGNSLFVDGSKIRANASIDNSWTKERCIKHLHKIDKRIKEILSECESADLQEENQLSLVKMKSELKEQSLLQGKVKAILAALNREDKKTFNTTDSDCTRVRGRQGSHAGYNLQSVVDEKHGLIVSGDVVNENNDLHQFADQIEHAHETLDKKCHTACADAGYALVDELEKIDKQGIKVIVPSQKQAQKNKQVKRFDKSEFVYDADKDCYICPDGHVLKYSYTNTIKRAKVYRGGAACKSCICFGECTKNNRGRSIARLLKAELRDKLEAQYDEPDSKKTYALRKSKVELPFGHIKRNLGVDSFLLRGFDGVKAEGSLFLSCFNIVRMISILGVSGFISMVGTH